MKWKWILIAVVMIAIYLLGFYIGGMKDPAMPAGDEHADHATPAEESHAGHAEKNEGESLYHCPMHPTYIVDQPGDCPICGMSLVPVVEEEVVEESSGVEGYAAIRVSPERQQLIGVKTGIVERRQMNKVIRTVGLVDYDEKRIAHIHTKISGWIEDLYVDYTGKLVEKGEQLLTIYSPELVSTQEEYLLALKGRKELGSSTLREVSLGSSRLYEATRIRLQLWDITEEQIDELEKTGEPNLKMSLHSPIDGFVLHKGAFEGKYVSPNDELYTIADLSVVWIYADIYEYEFPFIEEGQEARVSLSYLPGEEFVGTVDYIYPYMDEKTRTVKVRLVFDNPGWKLKPKMYANVKLKVDLGERMAIPEDAILDTGTRQVVFLYRDDGTFEPREVTLGQKVEDYYVLLDGLEEGDRIMTSANFLIDSESKLKAATQAMTGHQH
jgi:RND family efflux transporter MFP subunit